MQDDFEKLLTSDATKVPLEITEDLQRSWHENGYVILPKCFTSREIDEINTEVVRFRSNI